MAADNAARDPAPHIVIAGKGRSGSNRLLDIFDASPFTVCRNEMNGIEGSAFHGIGVGMSMAPADADEIARLCAALNGARSRRSARDRFDRTDKVFLTQAGRKILLPMSKGRLRAAMASAGLMRSAEEWSLPGWAFDAPQLDATRLVVKLGMRPTVTKTLAAADPRCRILHNLRNPFDYLQSWYNRFMLKRSNMRIFEEKFADVPGILAEYGRDDADRLRSPEIENVVEVELWRWRLLNERLQDLEALGDRRYTMMTYHEIDRDPVAAARRAYAFADLPFTDDIERRVAGMQNTLFSTPHRSGLDPDLCHRMIDKVLADSPLMLIEGLRPVA